MRERGDDYCRIRPDHPPGALLAIAYEMIEFFAAVHESVHGPSRHFAAKQRFGCFRREADID
jgi:hypothetical protein